MTTANSKEPASPAKTGFAGAFCTNVLNMVGVGPFLTIPLILGAMGGPQAMLGWAAGAILALCDGLVWAEFGAAFPQSGGPYVYLREAYGRNSWGQLASFLFLLQVVVAAPLTTASGAVGFAQYATFLLPDLTLWQSRIVAVTVCLIATVLLYRNIQQIATVSLVFTAALLATMGWIIWTGAAHFNPSFAFDFPPDAFHLSPSFFTGLGAATLIAMYDFSGYFNVCLIGAEIKQPEKNIPRCILLSIGFLAFCYAAMNASVIGVLPWKVAANSRAIVSDFARQVAGPTAATSMTILILIAAFASVYAVMLGYSRVPYAAAKDGHFFSAFARSHPVKQFPSFSVVAIGFASALACLLPLDSLIKALVTLQITTQYIAQGAGLLLLHRRQPHRRWPFMMKLYPVPVLVALSGWAFVLLSSGTIYIAVAIASLGLGIVIFLARAKSRGEWPFLAAQTIRTA